MPGRGVGGLVLGTCSQGTGLVLLDAALGGAIGFAVAPKKERWAFLAGGAAGAGLLGLLGTALVVAVAVARR